MKEKVLKSHLVGLFLLIVVFSKVNSQTCTPASVPYPRMGTNVPDVWNLPWINLWHQINGSHSSFGPDRLELAPDGWTTSKPNHNIRIGMDQPLLIPIVGHVKISYKGTLSQLDNFNYPVVTSQANFPQPGYSYYVLNVNIPVASVSGPTISMQFHGRVEDVKIMRPGFELDETQIIHPLYTSVLKNFTTLRWMPFLSTNAWYVNNQYDCAPTGTVNWSIRSNANMPQSMTGTKGGAWEYVVWISNEFNKDLWINIPVRATDDYVTNLAQFLKDNLKPGLNVYMEIGNETWNSGGGFCSFKQLQQIYGGDMNAHRRFHAVRGKEIVDIFASVWGWGEINNRIRMLIPGQIAYGVEGDGWAVKASLKWMDDNHGALNVKKYFYGAAATAYIGCHDFSSLPNMFNSMRNSIDVELFGEFSTESAFGGGYYGNKYEGWLGTAGEYGLKLLVYEGNPEFGSTGGGGLKAAAYDDPEMESTMLYAYNRWFSRYGYNALFNQFQGQFAPHGLYCLGTDLNRKSKLQSAIDIMTSNPAPPFDPQFRHIIPGTFLGKKFASYPSTWNNEPSYLMKAPWAGEPHLEGRQRWIFAANQNGNYSLDILHSNGKNAFYDIYLDGDLIYSNVMLPNTGGAQVYSSAQGVTLNFNVSYGVHVLKLQAKNETVDWIRLFKFDLINESPPFRPSIVSGDLYACNGQPDAKYEVDVDGSVCEYKWVGLPPTATINPDAGGPATGLPRSGARTNLIYVNWGSTPNGTYNLTVFGINAVGTSPGRAFNVLVTTCGFTMAPNPTCTNTGVTITPATPGAVNYKWDFGINSTPRTYTTTLAGTLPFNVVYTVSGSKTVSLTVTFSGGSTKTYLQNILVASSPTIGSITPALQSACSGGSVSLSVSGTGSSYQWYYSTNGGVTYTAYPGATLPRFTFTGLSGTTLFKASVTNLGCPSLTTSGAATANISTSVVSFSYGSSSYCSGVATPVGTFGGGSFSHLSGPGSILLNTLTGSITIAGSSVGVHTIRYFAPAAGACPSVAGQNTITITGGVSLAISGPTTFCGGTSTTLTASGATTYNWQPGNLSGAIQTLSPVGTTTYTISGTFAGCNAVTTHLLSMVPASTPGVNISALQNNVCSGSGMTFVATPVNGGTPAYQWKHNGIDIGTNSPTLTGSTFSHGDVIRVVMTGVGACINNTPVTSTGITLTVNPNLSPSITVTASQNNVCSGTTVTFTGVPTHGGSAPAYQWLVNGTPQGTGSATYAYIPAHSDQVQVRLTSNAVCASPTTVLSNIVAMTVSGTVTPTAAISANQNNICSGTGVTFSSTITGGGATPTYQWQVNGSNVGTNSPIYASSTLSNGQVVRLIMTSSSACASPSSVTTAGITMTVNHPLVGSPVSIGGCNLGSAQVSFSITAGAVGVLTITGTSISGHSLLSAPYHFVSAPLADGTTPVYIVQGTSSCTPITLTGSMINCACPAPGYSSYTHTPAEVCSGTNSTLFTVSGIFGSPNTFQWQISTDGGVTWVNTASGSANITVNNAIYAQNGHQYRLIMGNACGSTTTTTGRTLVVRPQVGITTITGPSESCAGVAPSSSFTAGAAHADSYNWGLIPAAAGSINGLGVVTWNVGFSGAATITASGISAHGCAPGSTATWSHNRRAELQYHSLQVSTCTAGLQAQVSFNLSGGSGTYTVNGTGLAGSSFASSWLDSGSYQFTVTGGGLCNSIIVPAAINCSCALPTIGVLPTTPSGVCEQNNRIILHASNVTDVYAPITYRWYANGVQIATGGHYTISSVSSSGGGSVLTITNATLSMHNTVYTLVARNNCGSEITTSGVSITVNGKDNAAFNYPLSSYCTLDNNLVAPSISGLPGGSFSYTTSGPGTLSLNAASGTFNPSTSGGAQSYTIFYNTTGICPNTGWYTVSITTNPGNALFSYAGSPYCNSNSIAIPTLGPNAGIGTISVISGSGLVFSDVSQGIVDLAASNAGTYTLRNEYNVVGCGTDTKTALITILPRPTVGINATMTTLCLGQQTTLQGTGASSYSWSGGITNNVPFTPMATTVYTVTGTDANNCSNTATQLITVHNLPTVGVNATMTTLCQGQQTTLQGTGASSYNWSGGITNNVPFAPTATTVYTVTGTDANNCSNTATQLITVHNLPTVGINATMTTLCLGQQTTLQGTGASSYSWSGGITNNVPFAPTATTVYTVTGTDANNCSNTATQLITVHNLPTVGINATMTTLCQGQQTTLQGTGASSYSWSGGITNNVPFAPTATTVYTVTGTDANNCSNTATQLITVHNLPTVGINATMTTLCQGQQTTLQGTGASSYSWSGGITNNTPFAPTSSGTYTVTGSTNGCSAMASIQITVYTIPGVPQAGTRGNVCLGNPLLFTAVGSNVLWYDVASGGIGSSAAPAPVTSGPHTYYATQSQNGCESARIAVSGSVDAPAPLQPLVYTSHNVCSDRGALSLENFTLTGGSFGVTPGIRIDNNGRLDISDAPMGIRVYTVIYTTVGSGACGHTTTSTVVTVTGKPQTPTLMYPQALYCNEGEAQPVGSFSGGTFSVSSAGLPLKDAFRGILNLEEARAGNYTVTYTPQNVGACIAESVPTSVTVQAPVAGSLRVVSDSLICRADSSTLELSGYQGTITWQQSSNTDGPASWTDITETSRNRYRTGALFATTRYRAKVRLNDAGCSKLAYSNMVRIGVDAPSRGGTVQSFVDVLCNLPARADLSLRDYTGKIQWQVSVSGSTGYRNISRDETMSFNKDALEAPYIEDYNTRVSYRAVVKNGACPADTSLAYEIRTCFKGNLVPNALAPNSSNPEEAVWNIRELRLKSNADVIIYSRYGLEVFRAKGREVNERPWDGGGLPAGTYYYLIDNRDSSPVLTGTVTIIK